MSPPENVSIIQAVGLRLSAFVLKLRKITRKINSFLCYLHLQSCTFCQFFSEENYAENKLFPIFEFSIMYIMFPVHS